VGSSFPQGALEGDLATHLRSNADHGLPLLGTVPTYGGPQDPARAAQSCFIPLKKDEVLLRLVVAVTSGAWSYHQRSPSADAPTDDFTGEDPLDVEGDTRDGSEQGRETSLRVALTCASRAASSGPRFGTPVLAAEVVDAPAGVDVTARPPNAISDAIGTKTSDTRVVSRRRRPDRTRAREPMNSALLLEVPPPSRRRHYTSGLSISIFEVRSEPAVWDDREGLA
jgi:hypothetical protein